MSITNIKTLSELVATALASYGYFDVNSYEAGLTGADVEHGVGMTTVQKDAFIVRYQLKDPHANDPMAFLPLYLLTLLLTTKRFSPFGALNLQKEVWTSPT